MKRKAVRTPRLILRPLQAPDYKAWLDAQINSLPKQSKWDSGPNSEKNSTKAKFTKLVKRHHELADKDVFYFFGVFKKKSGLLIGHIDFSIYARNSLQFANFGYRIYNRYWGHGFGQEASAAGLQIGFKHLKLNRLEAAINLDNKKSIRLVKAIGMRKEGIKKRYWFENGKWVDHLIYVANPEDIGLKATRNS